MHQAPDHPHQQKQQPARVDTPTRRTTRTHYDLDFSDDMRFSGGRKSSERETKFRQCFLEVPLEEQLINYYSCAFNKDYYLQHGAMYVTSNYICFRSNIFGQERKFIIPTAEVVQVDKINTFRLIPSGIVVLTSSEKYHFESFMNRHSAYVTLKKATQKSTRTTVSALPVPVLPRNGVALRPDESSTKRFIKSQSSCSLERKDTELEDTKEDFLRPLSATVMHDYVSRRMSCAAGSSGHHAVLFAPSAHRKSDSVVTGEFLVKEQVCQTDGEFPPTSSSGRDKGRSVDFHWDLSADNDPAITIRFSLRFLIRLGYFLCFLLTLSAIMGLSNHLLSTPVAKPTPFTIFDNPRILLDSIDLKPLNETLQLISSVCDITQKLLQQR